MKTVKFDKNHSKDFITELRKAVEEYFKKNNKTRFGNANMVFKSIFMLLLYFVPYTLAISGVITNNWLYWLLWVCMGVGMAGIGLSIMHDANHGSYSKNKLINRLFGLTLNILGGSAKNWRIQHNRLHHTFTNIHEMDPDVSPMGLLRFSPDAPLKKIHRLQYIYAWFFYGLMTLSWTFMKDFKDAVRYQKMGLYKQLKTSFAKEMTLIIATRILYFAYMVVLPLIFMDITWWQLIIGFLTVHFVAGTTLALIFQLAHVMEETKFPLPEDGSVNNQWAAHQLSTTLNFANNKKVFSWLIGGLNFQVEHHLFPHISHIHYSKIAPIVEKTAQEFNMPYNSENSFFRALASHGRMLYQLGR